MKYDGLLFDFDGVIADTEPLHWKSWVTALEPYGLQLTWPDYRRACSGVSALDMRAAMATVVPGLDRAQDLEQRYLAAKQLVFPKMAVDPPISAATRRFLLSLTGLRLGVVTTALREVAEAALLAAGILDVFEVRVYRDDVERPKPAPDAYLLAAARLGAERILVFEDTAAGAASARAAGLDVAMVESCDALSRVVEEALRDHAA